MIDYRLARFAAVGGANTALGLALIFALKAGLGLGDAAANAIGYGIGIFLGFAFNRQWTFGHAGPAGPALARYLLVLAVGYLANLVTVLGAIELLHVNSYAAQAAGVLPYAAIGYVGSRLFAFTPAR